MSSENTTQSRVSVVIPLFNAARYIGQAIDSALAQSTPVHEIIVVDDGSTDSPEKALAGYKDKIRYVKTENRGAAHARNIGIAEARGEYIAFLDADDVWEREKIEKQLNALHSKDAALVYCGRVDVDAQGSPLEEFEQSEFPQGEIFTQLIKTNHISTSSVVLVRKEVVQALGGFKELQGLKVSEDFELWCRIALRHTIAAVPERLVRYRLHETNISSNIKESYEGKITALGELAAECARVKSPEKAIVLLQCIHKKIADVRLNHAMWLMREREYEKARNAVALFQSLNQGPLPLKLLLVKWLPDGLLSALHTLKSRLYSRKS